MTEQLNVQQMAQRLLAADNILILCHKNPDGDTIGCGSALYYALKALEKTTAVLCSDAIPSRYAFTNPRLFKGEFEPRTVLAVAVAGLQLFGEITVCRSLHAMWTCASTTTRATMAMPILPFWMPVPLRQQSCCIRSSWRWG